MRGQLRRLRFGLSTILGLKAQGFFIPYRYADSVEDLGYPALRALFREAEPAFLEVLDAIETYGPDLRRIADEERTARFRQDWFPRLDAAVAYAIVRRHQPQRVVEVGSGHSTRFLARAVSDGGLPTRISCVDPAPRAKLPDGAEHFPVLLNDAPMELFETLEPKDILFIDSSHIAMPGTDVDRLFLDVLPRLRSDVFVHVHDITLPDAYPPEWAWRGYNEQTLVGALLQGGGYELAFASHYVTTTLSSHIERSVLSKLPLLPTAHETSLWLRKR